MFFAILWKNIEISLKELELIQAQDIRQIDKFIITFQTFFPERLKLLWWVIKRWKLLDENDLQEVLKDTKLIWTQDKNFWIQIKKKYKIKRFKITDLFHTDKEIKEKWIEIIKIRSDFGIVQWYQNIALYEAIDFEKPSRDMNMWMMPSKLTHIMLNIWLIDTDLNYTIYDPFSWSWTTWFLANFFWYDFVWSDIKTNYLIQNLERRQGTKFSKPNQFDVFQQDIFQPINIQKDKLIVITEWWLWPIVRDNTTIDQVNKYQNQVIETFKALLQRINEIKAYRSVFTIPYYIWFDNKVEETLREIANQLSLNMESIDEIYKREKQKIWRKIIILNN